MSCGCNRPGHGPEPHSPVPLHAPTASHSAIPLRGGGVLANAIDFLKRQIDRLKGQIDRLSSSKQDVLTAGDNISISPDGVISASGTGAGTGAGTPVDATLTQSGEAADAKKTGDRISSLGRTVTDLGRAVAGNEEAIGKMYTNAEIDAAIAEYPKLIRHGEKYYTVTPYDDGDGDTGFIIEPYVPEVPEDD